MRLGRGGRGRRRLRRVPLAVMAAILAVLVVWTVHEARKPGPWQRVFATREGLTGGRLATGGSSVPAISSWRCLTRRRSGATSRSATEAARMVVPVLDVGPWNVDDAYWSNGQRPAAERGRGSYRTPANRAGIDLSDATFATLGLRDNDFVEWRFVHRGYIPFPRLAAAGR